MVIYTDKRGFTYQVGQMISGGYRGMYQKSGEKKWRSMRLEIRKTYVDAQEDLTKYANAHKFSVATVSDENVICNNNRVRE